ncbi:uncharacterized protein [Triticum aestivum]|uniref:uncharacterized protein n=1 Tax=Triticum aestivum TaxID=4565 RepID=UPI001D0260DE|nr:uncharacterized protein LOC123145872 [Triticum aestivum]
MLSPQIRAPPVRSSRPRPRRREEPRWEEGAARLERCRRGGVDLQVGSLLVVLEISRIVQSGFRSVCCSYKLTQFGRGLDALISVSSPRVFIFPISVVATRGEGDKGSAGFDARRGGRG